MRGVKNTLSWAVAAGVALTAGSAGAVDDINQTLPNLLLLLDSSGSMEYMPSGQMPTTCDPSQPSDLNRWGSVIEVLTGTIQNRGCYKVNRSDPAFATEYRLSGDAPYDAGYFLPWHHYTSNGCLSTPGVLPFAVFNWSSEPVRYRPWDAGYHNNRCNGNNGEEWAQDADGLLDTYRDRVRFSMMMFDSHPDDGVGFQGQATNSTGFIGLWSYFDGWTAGAGSAITGHPADCGIQNQTWEVGARNYAAPPWEGRMVPFGTSGADIQEIRTTNDRIQQIITALRPYGGTPIDGMMDDAYVYFHDDLSEHPHPQINEPFAPAGDPLVQGGCRKSFILLVSDGEPNLDLRPGCEQSGSPNGKCPYKRGWERARDLYLGTPSVGTFVVGFGLSQAAGVDCATLTSNDLLDTGGTCDGATGALKACCTLSRIALEGGTGNALFADDPVSLKNALAAVLDQVATQSTSRTLPVFAAASSQAQVGTSLAPAVSYEFNSAFTPTPGALWAGHLDRRRWACDTQNVPNLEDVDDTKGDDFAANINAAGVGGRRFITVVPDVVSGDYNPDYSIRPLLNADDGVGLLSGTVADGSGGTVPTAVGNAPGAMGIEGQQLPPVCDDLNATTDQDCASKIMNWELGGSNGGGLPERTFADGTPNHFGAIYHSTPVVHNRPTAFTRDPAYEVFAAANATRPIMLYTATVDGQVHGIKVAANDATDTLLVDQKANNELWAFIPPAVLPTIKSQYPSTPQLLLDGAVVVKDLPFERSLSESEDGTAVWKTVLVGGGGAGGGFYYALDVTDPYNPVFLWQLSTETDGTKLFGDASGTPAIATIAVDENNNGTKEVAVAILPGGHGVSCSGNKPSKRQDTSTFDWIKGFHTGGDFTGSGSPSITPDDTIRCWEDDGSRSVTIVRLSDGKVLRSFRPPASNNSQAPGYPVNETLFDSPVMHVVPYPNRTGQVANRIYAADVDGTLWRIDLSKPTADDWDTHLFFDGYPSSPSVASEREPIPAKPVISVDGIGNTVVLFSTGDNEDFTSSNVTATVWSLTEVPVPTLSGAPFQVYANWVVSEDTSPLLTAGERAVGPVAVFDQIAYFATFAPPGSSTSCDYGAGKLWAVDFQTNMGQGQGAANTPPPEPRFPDGSNGFKYNADGNDSPDLQGSPTIFGVAVTATPTCVERVEVTDDYVGKHNALASAPPPTFKLRFHTGAEGGGTGGSDVNAGEMSVTRQRPSTRIESWGTVVD